MDSSDWWSYTRQEELPTEEPRQPVKFQSRKPAETNFQVAGITLGEAWDFDFSVVRSKFGKATEVQRGDAASGRNQICYRSSSGNVHLIFELGEVDSVVYLFEDGPEWEGSDLPFHLREDELLGNFQVGDILIAKSTGAQLLINPVYTQNPSARKPACVRYVESRQDCPQRRVRFTTSNATRWFV
jgi:hypothetical protein